ncbi:MAG: hypothetical protein M3Q11_06275 [Pseudomonadota bacterium]|nr:hypothetical protein [Pseudomonadota bacterium]
MTTPQDRQTSKPGSTRVPDPQAEAPAGPPTGTDPQAGLDREVGDLENPDAVDEEGALPGRVGGGLAGG